MSATDAAVLIATLSLAISAGNIIVNLVQWRRER